MSKIKFFPIAIFLILLIIVNKVNTVDAVDDSYHLILGQRSLSIGDEGADVAILQQKLKEVGVYNGKVDGLYGPATAKAVKILQGKYDLKADGIAGKKTLSILPKNSLQSRMDVSREEIIQLAYVIHGEARGEGFKGKVAVGAVVINRVKNNKFPDSIREVILEEGQFSCIMDGQANLYPSKSSIKAAKAALLGYDPTYGSIFFYNPRVATNVKWISGRPVVIRIGNHLFAR